MGNLIIVSLVLNVCRVLFTVPPAPDAKIEVQIEIIFFFLNMHRRALTHTLAIRREKRWEVDEFA